MSTLHHQIRLTYRRLAAQPVPSEWTACRPELARYQTISELVTAIRDHEHPADADRVVRALATLAHDHPDAGTIVLEGLIWSLRSRIGANSSTEFRDDALVELAIVVLEADDLDRLDNLPQRLARRAHGRASRRLHSELNNRAVEQHITDTDTDRFVATTDDPAEIATDRAHLAETIATIDEHIDAGRLSRRAWEDYRDGWLAPAAGWWRIQPDRARTYRGRRAVEAVLAHAS